MDIAYYPGCTLHTSSKLYDIQTKAVLEELDIRLLELEDWNCCGATSAGKTDDFMAVALPARNLGIADAMGLSNLVIPCSACYSRMLVAQVQLKEDPELAEEINRELEKKVTGQTRIISILKLLDMALDSGVLQEKAEKKLKGLRPVCYYGCLQTRFPSEIPAEDNIENPQSMERIVRACGAKPIDWSCKTACCGASASVNDPDLANNLMGKILEDAAARDANCFVTSCPMCQLNLDAYQKLVRPAQGMKKALPVYFITEMVGLTMGKSVEELQIDRHIVDSISLLQEVPLT